MAYDLSLYEFKNPDLLDLALTHKSFHNENLAQSVGHNERLEFLGDAVLGLVLSEAIYHNFPTDSEGQMSQKRAALVNEEALAKIAHEMGLSQKMKLGKGELATGGAEKPRLLASVLEALIGAVYIDGGYIAAKEVVNKLYESTFGVLARDEDFRRDYKTMLQELVQKKSLPAPIYQVMGEEGPAHQKTFIVRVCVQEKELAQGSGRSKKQAEQEAARIAIQEKHYEQI